MVCVLLSFAPGFLSAMMGIFATGLFIVVTMVNLSGSLWSYGFCRLLNLLRCFDGRLFSLSLFKLNSFQATTVDKRRTSFNGCYLVPAALTSLAKQCRSDKVLSPPNPILVFGTYVAGKIQVAMKISMTITKV